MSSKIEWCDETWNPISGCDNQLPCRKNCYARRMAHRLAGRCGYPEAPNEFKPTFHKDQLDKPKHWKKPRRIFVCSMGDMFCDGALKLSTNKYDWTEFNQDKILNVIERCSRHTFIILTKRPDNALDFFRVDSRDPVPKNLILGTSASTQEEFDSRVKDLAQIPSGGMVISLEPLLGPIDISAYKDVFGWVIVGGETGPGARPMHPDWVRKIRDDCKEFEISFFFKGWGDWIPEWQKSPFEYDTRFTDRIPDPVEGFYEERGFFNVGKKYSGRLLDGVEHSEFPVQKGREA